MSPLSPNHLVQCPLGHWHLVHHHLTRFKIRPQFYCQMCEKFKLLKTRIKYVFYTVIVQRIQFWSQKYTTFNLKFYPIGLYRVKMAGNVVKLAKSSWKRKKQQQQQQQQQQQNQFFIKHLYQKWIPYPYSQCNWA